LFEESKIKCAMREIAFDSILLLFASETLNCPISRDSSIKCFDIGRTATIDSIEAYVSCTLACPHHRNRKKKGSDNRVVYRRPLISPRSIPNSFGGRIGVRAIFPRRDHARTCSAIAFHDCTSSHFEQYASYSCRCSTVLRS